MDECTGQLINWRWERRLVRLVYYGALCSAEVLVMIITV